jgi:hypothetical protein
VGVLVAVPTNVFFGARLERVAPASEIVLVACCVWWGAPTGSLKRLLAPGLGGSGRSGGSGRFTWWKEGVEEPEADICPGHGRIRHFLLPEISIIFQPNFPSLLLAKVLYDLEVR